MKLKLPNKGILDRPISHLYPLEIPLVVNNNDPLTIEASPGADIDQQKHGRRKAAINARRKITEQLRTDAVTASFSVCRECHEENTD